MNIASTIVTKEKVNYLVVLYIIFMGVWGILPFAFIGADGFNFLKFIYLFYGVYKFSKYRTFKFPHKYKTLILWIFGGIMLSMISAFLFYGQSFFTSLIAYRFQYLILTPLFLAKINPTQNEIIKSLFKFIKIFTFVYVLRIILPGVFLEAYDWKGDIKEILLGYSLLTIPLYYTFQQLTVKFSLKKLLYVCFVIFLIFLTKNRSTLFPVLLISGCLIFKIKSKFKPILIAFIIIIAGLGAYQAKDDIKDLIEETQTQLDDDDYVRNKAFNYYVEESFPNTWCRLFGNGLISVHTSSLVEDLKEIGIFNSDLGFIGYWNEYGLIPIVIFLYLYLNAIFNRKIPLYLKCVAIQTLICGLTISYFGLQIHMLFFILFYYLYFTNLVKYKQDQKKRTKSIQSIDYKNSTPLQS